MLAVVPLDGALVLGNRYIHFSISSVFLFSFFFLWKGRGHEIVAISRLLSVSLLRDCERVESIKRCYEEASITQRYAERKSNVMIKLMTDALINILKTSNVAKSRSNLSMSSTSYLD